MAEHLFSSNLDFTNTGSTMVGARETDDNTGALAVVTAVNPLVNITTDLMLNVTTTAAVNAMSSTTPPSGVKMVTVLLEEWNRQYSFMVGSCYE